MNGSIGRNTKHILKMEQFDINQNVDTIKCGNDVNSILSQHEALRRATLLKHRKVSTQLKLDMVQRQLSNLRRSVTDPDNDRQFYRLQMQELSTELQDLGSTLDKVERNAFYARRRLLRQCGLDLVSSSTGAISLSSSNPSLFSSTDNLSRSTSRSSLKNKVRHLMSSPTSRFKKRHLFGELRAVASLSSLNMKAHSPTGSEEDHPHKETKSWKTPLRFLGNLVDSRFRRKLWSSSTKRTKSADNILDDKKPRRLSDSENKDDCSNGFENSEENVFNSSTSSSSSSSESEDDEDEEEDWRTKSVTRYTCRAPVVRKISGQQKAQIDPAILAEIEDFEKMAAQYIKQHS